MNTKKLNDLKLIKQKINATFQLLEELEQLAENVKINDDYLTEAMGNLEDWYWEIDDLEQELKD